MQHLFPQALRAQLQRWQELIRFAIVGLSGVVVNTLVLWLLVERGGFAVPLASAIATEIAILANFLLNDRWTFGPERRNGSFGRRLLRYNSVAFGGLLITAAVLTTLTIVLGVPLLAANLVAVGCAMAWNYTINSQWTWARSGPSSPALAHEPRITRRLEPLAEPAAAQSGGPRATMQLQPVLDRARSETTGPRATMQLQPVLDRARSETAGPRATMQLQPVRERALGDQANPRATLVLEPVEASGPQLQQQPRAWQRAAVELAIALTVGAAALAWLALGLPGAWATIACLLLSLVFVVQPGASARRVATLALATAVGVSTVDYLAWRAGVISWQNWWVGLPLFVAELFGALHTLGLQYTIWPRREPALASDEDPTRRPIFIFIPTVDEGPEVLEPTLQGALAARAAFLRAHPHGRVTIVLCNDGYVAGVANWRAAEDLALRLGVVCVTRRVGGGAKAGNIEHARQRVGATGSALVAIFDADQIATPEFLLRLVAPMADSRVGWVQSGQYYHNLDNPVARWANDQQALFYKVLCPGKAAQNAAFICGTNVLLRAAALDEIGGLPQDSVTEDFAASIDLHPRWKSIFVREELAHGLGPLSLASYFKQQGRWATGTLGVLRSHWRAIFLPRRGGLSLSQRVQYALACTHYLSGVRDLVYLIAPLIFLVLSIAAVQGATLDTFLWHFLPYWIAAQLAFWQIGWGKTSMRGIIMGFASFPVLIASLLTVVSGRRVQFSVTAKRREQGGNLWLVWPHLLAMLACVAGLAAAALYGPRTGSTLVSAFWVLYSVAMLGAVLWLAWRDGRATNLAPRPLRQPRRLALPSLRLALSGAFAAALVVALVGFAPSMTPAQVFVAEAQQGRPVFGMALPYNRVAEGTAAVQQALGHPVGIVGRTQDINDRFDRSWAADLQAQGGRPWITLLFAVPGQPSYESSLPAIANGFHDAALHRWARDMRAYGQPVYLSVLPHVDRNWSASSAVTNGGIPQDAPRAWARIRQILQQEGAVNVAMVWSPANPAADEPFAPPAAAVDAVLLSLISYPDQEWADPAVAIAATQARHPDVPLLVEVSAAGDPQRRAAWLRAVGAAVGASSGIEALIYHDGAPNPRATAAEHAGWTLAGEPQVLAAMGDALVAAKLGPVAEAGTEVRP